PDPEEVVARVSAVTAGAPVHAVSAKMAPELASLRSYLLAGRTVALLGPSGAGKSSIINALAGQDRQAIGDVRVRDARGPHTSVHREVIPLACGAVVIDTPGMREVQLGEAGERVDDTFDDILRLGQACRFRDCRHHREPGCAVKSAVDAGKLAASRYEGYLKL